MRQEVSQDFTGEHLQPTQIPIASSSKSPTEKDASPVSSVKKKNKVAVEMDKSRSSTNSPAAHTEKMDIKIASVKSLNHSATTALPEAFGDTSVDIDRYVHGKQDMAAWSFPSLPLLSPDSSFESIINDMIGE